MSYAEIAFSESAKLLQKKAGSRANYARMEAHANDDMLTRNEIEFISGLDGFYMATIGENGFPYIQFRGGPKGFIKPLDERRLAFIDFKGNMQFISVGNIASNSKVALFFMDYAAKTRLKIFAEVKVVELKDDQELFSTLNLADYKFKPERMMILNVKAYDWNCPQHITPRYTLDEIKEAYSTQQDYIDQLEAELKRLKAAQS